MTKTIKTRILAGVAALAVVAALGVLATTAIAGKPVEAPKTTASAVNGEAVTMNGWTETGRRTSGGGP